MSPEAGDDIVVAVAIDIEDEHLCAAGVGEFIVMEGPFFAGSGIFGPFIPSSFFEEVGAAVAIEIAEAEAVVVGRLGADFGNDVKFPRLLGRFYVGSEEAKFAILHRDEFKFPVAGEVAHFGGFISDFGGDAMNRPNLGRLLRLQIKVEMKAAGVRDLEDVGSPVAVDVEDPALKRTVLVSFGGGRVAGAVAMLGVVLWTFEPKWSGEEVGDAIAINVAEGRAFRIDAFAEDELGVGWCGLVGIGGDQDHDQSDGDDKTG